MSESITEKFKQEGINMLTGHRTKEFVGEGDEKYLICEVEGKDVRIPTPPGKDKILGITIVGVHAGDLIDDQLQHAMVNFLSDEDKNRVNRVEKRLELSPIFKWFSEDFEKAAGSVQAFVLPWMSHRTGAFAGLKKDKIPIDYLPYDWSLNQANRYKL